MDNRTVADGQASALELLESRIKADVHALVALEFFGKSRSILYSGPFRTGNLDDPFEADLLSILLARGAALAQLATAQAVQNEPDGKLRPSQKHAILTKTSMFLEGLWLTTGDSEAFLTRVAFRRAALAEDAGVNRIREVVMKTVSGFDHPRSDAPQSAGGRHLPSEGSRVGPDQRALKAHRRGILKVVASKRHLELRTALARQLGVSTTALNGMVAGDHRRYSEQKLEMVLGKIGCPRDEWDRVPPKPTGA